MQKAQSHVATFSVFSEARQLKQWISSHLGGVILCNKLMYNKNTGIQNTGKVQYHNGDLKFAVY